MPIQNYINALYYLCLRNYLSYIQSEQFEKSETKMNLNLSGLKIGRPFFYTLTRCSGNNQIQRMCINQNCKQQSIACCFQHWCKCQKQHRDCSLSGKIQRIIELIQGKMHDTTEIKQYLNQKIDAIIDQISDFREKLLTDIDEEIRFIPLHRFEKDFYKQITKHEKLPQSFDSIQAAQLWDIVNFTDQYKNDMINQTKDLLKIMEEEINVSMQKVYQQVSMKIHKEYVHKNVRSRHLEKERKRKFSLNQEKMIDFLTTQSSICITRELSQRLVRFFEKKLKSLNMLYKASKNQFSISKYYENCGTATNTIILCLSNKNKIVGFYTPFAFYSEGMKQNEWVQDKNRDSFSFSLTNNDKLTLVQQKFAFHRKFDREFIQIGCWDMTIRDEANKSMNTDLCCNSYYANTNYYIFKDKESNQRFNGNETQKCSLNEWEVWKVEFQSSE